MANETWLDGLGAKTVEDDGDRVQPLPILNFVGATVTPDPTNKKVDIAFSGGTGLSAGSVAITLSGNGTLGVTSGMTSAGLLAAARVELNPTAVRTLYGMQANVTAGAMNPIKEIVNVGSFDVILEHNSGSVAGGAQNKFSLPTVEGTSYTIKPGETVSFGGGYDYTASLWKKAADADALTTGELWSALITRRGRREGEERRISGVGAVGIGAGEARWVIGTSPGAVTGMVGPTFLGGYWRRVYEGRVFVTWFGTTGVSAAIDAPAIHAATAFAVANSKALHFPKGSYELNPASGWVVTLANLDSLEITGDGVDITKLNIGAGDTTIPGLEVSITGTARFCLSHLTFFAGGTQVYIHGGILNRTSCIHDVFFQYPARKGLHLASVGTGTTWRDLNFLGGTPGIGQITYGFYAEGTACLHFATIYKVRAADFQGYGMWIGNTGAQQSAGSVGTSIFNLTLEANGAPDGSSGGGLYLQSAGVTLYTPFFEGNRHCDVVLDSNYDAGDPGAGLTKTRCVMHNAHFYDAHATQLDTGSYRRALIVNHGIYLSIYDADVALSFPSFVDAGAFSASAISLMNAPDLLTVRSPTLQIALRHGNGQFAPGATVCVGSSPTVTKVNIISGTYGNGALVLASGDVAASNNRVGVYLLRFKFSSGVGTVLATHLGGDNFVTFSASGDYLAFKATDDTNAAVAVFACRAS